MCQVLIGTPREYHMVLILYWYIFFSTLQQNKIRYEPYAGWYARKEQSNTSHLFFQEEDVELIKVLFDMYDRDRDGMITVEEACLLCT